MPTFSEYSRLWRSSQCCLTLGFDLFVAIGVLGLRNGQSATSAPGVYALTAPYWRTQLPYTAASPRSGDRRRRFLRSFFDSTTMTLSSGAHFGAQRSWNSSSL